MAQVWICNSGADLHWYAPLSISSPNSLYKGRSWQKLSIRKLRAQTFESCEFSWVISGINLSVFRSVSDTNNISEWSSFVGVSTCEVWNNCSCTLCLLQTVKTSYRCCRGRRQLSNHVNCFILCDCYFIFPLECECQYWFKLNFCDNFRNNELNTLGSKLTKLIQWGLN